MITAMCSEKTQTGNQHLLSLSPADCSPGLSCCSASRGKGDRSFDQGEPVGDLGEHHGGVGDGRVGVRQRQIRKALRRPHGRLVNTVADARAIASRNDEREIRVDRVAVKRPTTAGLVMQKRLYGPYYRLRRVGVTTLA